VLQERTGFPSRILIFKGKTWADPDHAKQGIEWKTAVARIRPEFFIPIGYFQIILFPFFKIFMQQDISFIDEI
jgi:hypothetical protein